MKNIELYDILTLEDDKDYSVLNIVKEDDKTFYLVAEIDEEENADIENLRILEDNEDGTLSQIIDDDKIRELKNKFISIFGV